MIKENVEQMKEK